MSDTLSDRSPPPAGGGSNWRGKRRLETKKRSALMLAAPAIIFLTVCFAVPLLGMLARSFGGPEGGFSLDAYSSSVDAARIKIFLTTARISIEVATLCLLIGYPTAYFLTRVRPAARNMLMLLVLIPYSVSALVRTFAWIILLGRTGFVNDSLGALKIPGAPVEFLFTELGVLIGMTYVLVPYAIFVLYAVMNNVDLRFLQVSESLGAHPTTTFLRVYLPMTMPGVLVSWLLVFILSIGYYITPALMGGPKQQMIAAEIEYAALAKADWATAAALATILLVVTLSAIGLAARLMSAARGRYT